MAVIDHLVYAVPDVADALDELERRTGVRAEFGGSHPGLGTHNALVSLGDCYLEIIGPDPDQPEPARPRPFGLDELDHATLVTYAVRPTRDETLDELVERARVAGHDPGVPIPMSRRTPTGAELHWRLTMPTLEARGAIPFLIDWGDTPNPAATVVGGLSLIELVAETPDHEFAGAVVRALGLDVPVHDGIGLTAIIDTPRGRHSL